MVKRMKSGMTDKFFIEIGSCDFDTLLPLAKSGWKGIFVEPIKELLHNIPDIEGCFYENCAVWDKNDSMTFKFYDPVWAKGWQRGVGSLSQMNTFNANPHWKENELTRTVKVRTLAHIIEKYDVKKIDFLKIDIEGQEYRILENYSWKVVPNMIKVETRHWDTIENGKLEEWIIKLNDKGYLTYSEKDDLYAIK